MCPNSPTHLYVLYRFNTRPELGAVIAIVQMRKLSHTEVNLPKSTLYHGLSLGVRLQKAIIYFYGCQHCLHFCSLWNRKDFSRSNHLSSATPGNTALQSPRKAIWVMAIPPGILNLPPLPEPTGHISHPFSELKWVFQTESEVASSGGGYQWQSG